MASITNCVPRRLFLPALVAFLTLACTAMAAPPAAPSGFTTTYTNYNSNTHVWRFSWQDNSTDEDGFAIYGAYYDTTTTSPHWVTFLYDSFEVDAGTKASQGGTYSVSGGLSSTLFRYEGVPGNYFYFPLQWYIVAYKGPKASPTDTSPSSNVVSYGAAPGPGSGHGAPTGLSVTAPAQGGDGSVRISFTDNSNVEGGFEVQYSPAGANNWQALEVIDFNVTTTNVGGVNVYGYQNRTVNTDMFLPKLLPGTNYDFRVRALDYAGNATGFSNVASRTTGSTLLPPSSLTATAVGENTVDLSFVNNSTADSGYHFQYREASSSTWLEVGTVDNPFFTILDDLVLSPGATFQFQARAYRRNVNNNTTDPVQYSTFSNIATVTTGFNAPTNLVATTPGEGRVNLSWTDNSSAEGNFQVQVRIKGNTQWSHWQYLEDDTTSLNNQIIAPGTTLEVQVRATAGAQAQYVSAFSNIAEVTTTFNAPTNFTATASSTDRNRISFSWTDNSAVETEYELQYRKAGDPNFSTRKFIPNNGGTAPNNMTLADLPEFDPGTQYEFRIRAVVSGGDGSVISGSAFSSTATTTTLDGFSNKSYAPITMGVPFTFQLLTSSQQTRTDWSVSTLPAGLSFDSATGIISGTPTVAGLHTVQLTANFNGGGSHVMNLSLRILRPEAAPQVTAAIGEQVVAPSGTATVALGSKFSDLDTDAAVRMQTTKGTLDVVLYSSLTPNTVANFLSYNYNDTIFHRSPPGFVLQGGGYKAYESPDVFSSVTRQAPVGNEPGISNLASTISMAKVGDDPNSATSEFFFNLSDSNASNLDNQNGGFTAFGRVSDTSMTALADLTSVATSNYAVKVRQNDTTPSSANAYWENCPIDASSAPSSIDQTKLLKITSITNIPVLTYTISSAPDGAVATAAVVGTELQITGVAPGSTSLVVAARDVDGNTTSQTVPINVTNMTASVALVGLAQTYDGTPRQVTATTVPAGLGVTFTYDGSPTAPTNAGSYAVVATVNDPNYSGSASGTLVVSKAAATFTLTGLLQTYDGTPKSAGAITNPPGLPVSFTYDGSATPPTAHGSYAVEATLNAPNHTASPMNGTLTIQGQPASDWRTQNFTQAQITAGLAADDADADGDGVSNLAEYALGTNPNASSAAPAAPVRDANGLTLTFTRPKGLNVVYGAESSDNLSTWTPLTLEVIADGPVQTIQVRDPLSTGDLSRRFIRLKFTAPP